MHRGYTVIMSHTTYDSHDGPPTLDARRLSTWIRPTFALVAKQDPVFQTSPRLLPLRYASSPFPHSAVAHAYIHERRRVGSTDVANFASPLEFVKHAKWLMQGAPRTLDRDRSPRCKCKYCNPDDSGDIQSVISRELRRVRARVLARIDGDEVQDSEDDADADADPDADAEVSAGVGAGAEAEVVMAETATAVPATDQGNAGRDGNQ
jgi:hypothetical protein